MIEKQRIEAQPGFVLHSYPYRETSLIIEVLSRDHGRLAIVARGARRPKSAVRGVLMAFQPLNLSWFGKSELKTLHAAEWQGGTPQLAGLSLICGFYINELILQLLHRDDPHEQLFNAYREAVQLLAIGLDVAPTLRQFEVRLLEGLGYGLELTREAQGGPAIQADAHYRYEVMQGPVRWRGQPDERTIAGSTLLAMAAGDYSSPAVLQQSKLLMRSVLGHYLEDRPLHSRQLLRDLNQI